MPWPSEYQPLISWIELSPKIHMGYTSPGSGETEARIPGREMSEEVALPWSTWPATLQQDLWGNGKVLLFPGTEHIHY